MQTIVYGIVLLLFAGLLQGTFAVFFRFVSPLRFSQYWLLYAFVGLFLCPLIVMLFVIPHALTAILSLSIADLFLPGLFGALWGVSIILLGKALERIGLASAFTIILGLSVLTMVLPVSVLNKPHAGALVPFILGMFLVAVGVVFSAYGRYRHTQVNAKKGILFAVFSGLLTPAFSFGITSGRPIAYKGVLHGASSANAIFLLWFILMFSGFVVTLFYSMYEIGGSTIRIWHRMNLRTVLPCVVGGIFWFGAFALYSFAPGKLGNFGASYGWALFIAVSLVVSVVWGLLYSQRMGKGFRLQLAGAISLLLGMFLISIGFGK